MYKELPAEWQKEFDNREQKIISNGGVFTTDLETYSQKRTLSVLLIPDDYTKKSLEQQLQQIPADLRSKLVIQPTAGFHLSIQWSLLTADTVSFVQKVKKILTDLPLLRGQTFTTYATDVNLTSVTILPDSLTPLRETLENLFTEFGFTPGLPNIGTAWTSLARYIQQPTKDEFIRLQNLPKTNFPTSINQAVICINDPFLTFKKSKILETIELRK